MNEREREIGQTVKLDQAWVSSLVVGQLESNLSP